MSEKHYTTEYLTRFVPVEDAFGLVTYERYVPKLAIDRQRLAAAYHRDAYRLRNRGRLEDAVGLQCVSAHYSRLARLAADDPKLAEKLMLQVSSQQSYKSARMHRYAMLLSDGPQEIRLQALRSIAAQRRASSLAQESRSLG